MKHPYIGLPDRQFWKKEPGIQEPSKLDPVSHVPFKISQTDRIVTAGSCFAQHVAGFMSASGFNHHITEPAHPMIGGALAKKHNYGMFSARYGNIYTARQLKQLLDRAYGRFTPLQQVWESSHGDRVVDPFRPQIQPRGFLNEAELLAEQAQHFRGVRDAIEQMDVFVFTLGLTEAWVDDRDGAVFPIAPGVVGGRFDADLVSFRNFDETETYDDLKSALKFIQTLNPDVKIILTVSPVPLNATYEDQHVLVSTTWSKSVLRVAAQKAVQQISECCYFPSYEIITSPYVRGRYFADDCREVTEEGVEHVMQLFMSHFANLQDTPQKTDDHDTRRHITLQHEQKMQERVDILCDEAAIDNQ